MVWFLNIYIISFDKVTYFSSNLPFSILLLPPLWTEEFAYLSSLLGLSGNYQWCLLLHLVTSEPIHWVPTAFCSSEVSIFYDGIRFSLNSFSLPVVSLSQSFWGFIYNSKYRPFQGLPLLYLYNLLYLFVFMFHNFIFCPKDNQVLGFKASYQTLWGISKICSCSKITGGSSWLCYSFAVGFVIVGLDELVYFSSVALILKEFPLV